MPFLLILLQLLPAAVAGSGPWTVSGGYGSLYLGAEVQDFNTLALSSGLQAPDAIEVDDGVETLGVKFIATYGLVERLELDLEVPFQEARAQTTGGPVCELLALDACKTTRGLAAVRGRVKGLVVDELGASPVSVAVYGEARLGSHTADERARITNLSEGTNDLGLGLSLGRGGSVGRAVGYAYAEGLARYRLANTTTDDGRPVPGFELLAEAEALAGTATVMVGPAVAFWTRPRGDDFEEVDLTSTDRLSLLNGTSLRVGGKLIVRSPYRVSLVLSGYGTVYAVNNPDPLLLGVGLGFDSIRFRRLD